jgi:hypothetical protein
LAAAQDAAAQFVNNMPPTINLGLESFAGTPAILVLPTTDRVATVNQIHTLKLAESTATGEALSTALNAIDQGVVFDSSKDAVDSRFADAHITPLALPGSSQSTAADTSTTRCRAPATRNPRIAALSWPIAARSTRPTTQTLGRAP